MLYLSYLLLSKQAKACAVEPIIAALQIGWMVKREVIYLPVSLPFQISPHHFNNNNGLCYFSYTFISLDLPRKMSCSPMRTKPEIPKGLEKEERGDLPTFYDTVYLGRVQVFALKLEPTSDKHHPEVITQIRVIGGKLCGLLLNLFVLINYKTL